MKKILFVVCVGSLIFLSNRLSFADFDASFCFTGCNTAHVACTAKIDPLYEKELKYLRDECDKAKSECYNKCDNERINDTRERREKLSQQPQDQQPQDQQSQDQQPQDQPPQDQPPQEQQ